MNKSLKNSFTYFFLFLFAFSSKLAIGQSEIIVFEDSSLDQVIDSLEQRLDFIFNYDPDFLQAYQFSGRLDARDINKLMRELLYDSPFTFELDRNTVLIYEEDQMSYRICGRVVDGLSQEALIAASIATKPIMKGSQSDADGYFDFTIKAFKNQLIEISYLGYQPIIFRIKDYQGMDCPVYTLELDGSLSYEEIIVTDYLLDGIEEGEAFGSYQLDFNRLSKNHSNVEHDILKTAQLLPGITSIDDSATNLQIRGSSPDQNLLLWEGAPIYNAGHIFGMISAINPFAIDDVKIFKGAHDPKYDNRVGGVVDISLTDAIDNDFHGSIGSTLTEFHTSLELPIVEDKLSMVLSARRSINELFNSPPLQSYTDKVFQYSIIDDQDGLVDADQTLKYNDWNSKLLYQASDRLRMRIGIYSNQQDFNYTASYPDDPFISSDEISVATRAINGAIDFKPNDQWMSSISYYDALYTNAYKNEGFEDGALLSSTDLFNDIKDRNFTFNNEWKPASAWTLHGGYSYNTKEVNLDLGDDSSYEFDFGKIRNELASFHNVFFASTFHRKNWKIDGGTRASYYQEQKRWVNAPRMSLQYFMNDQWKLKADGGIYHQFVSQLSDFGTTLIRVDNPLWILNASEDQLNQKARKIAAGFVYQHNTWLLDVDAYYNHTTGLNSVAPLSRLLGGNHALSLGTGTTKGIDVLVKRRWSSFNAWVNYSLSEARYHFPDIIEEPFLAPNDIRHNVNVVASYKIKNIQFSLNGHYHSGLAYSLPEIEEVDLTLPQPFTHRLDYQSFNTYRLKPYQRVDFNINYRPKFKKVQTEISLTMINVLGYENVFSRDYYLQYSEDVLVPELRNVDQALLRRTPLLLIRFYW